MWRLEVIGDECIVELEGRRCRVGVDDVVLTPVPAPPEEVLAKCDPCFAESLDAFEQIHHDADHMFSIYRCRQHASVFLRDVRGGLAMYEVFIWLGAIEETEWESVWRRYHEISVDLLRLDGVCSAVPS